MTTKAVSTTEETAPGALAEITANPWDDWQAEPVEGVAPIFPMLTLVQKEVPDIPNSGKHGGEFYFSDTDQFAPVAIGVILHVVQTRAMFSEDEKAPLCASDNGIAPRPNQPLWDVDTVNIRGKGEQLVALSQQPSSCATCPYGEWLDDEKPVCRESYLALFESENDGALYRIRFAGTAIRPFRTWMGRLLGSGVRRGRSARPKPPFSKRVKLEPVREENKELAHVWYRPEIQNIEDVPDELAPEYIAFERSLREQFARTVAESHTDMAAEPAGESSWGDGSQTYAAPGGRNASEDMELPFS